MVDYNYLEYLAAANKPHCAACMWLCWKYSYQSIRSSQFNKVIANGYCMSQQWY